MDATISVVCYKSKTLSNGEHPLMLRISKDGKKKYQSLGISVNPKFWDFQKNKPKPKCPNLEYLQKIILDKKLELQKKKLEIKSDQKEYSAATLLEANANLLVAKTVDCFYKEIIAQCEINNKCGNRLVYLNSYNSLKRFTNGKLEIPFNSINVAWLEKYEKWLRSNGNKETTISLMFRTLRSTYNKAIKERCAHLSDYPFQEYKISKFDTSTQKRAIAKTDMLKFTETSQPIGQKKYVELSKDIFIFSYLCGGINFTDIANLTQENIVNGRLHYIRQKTGKLIKIGIPHRVLQQLKMIHVEKLMGSSLKDIRIQLFGDAFLTVLLAFGLSLLIINDCLSFFNGLFASHLNVHFFFSLQMLPLLVLFVLVMSIVPAWYISHRLSQLSFSEYKTLYGGKKKQRFIALLVILQFSISIGLIFATLVANEQINLIKERAYCYENRIEIGDFNAAPATILKEELEKHVQGIESIALSQGSILNSWIRELSIKQADGTEKSSYLLMLYSDANLVKTMGFKLLSGNAPEQLQKQYAYPALVNESYVRMLIPAGINAIGKPLKEFDQSADSLYIIGGVLQDFPFSSLENEITPVILYLPPTERMSGANYLQIKLIESNKQETLHQIAQIWEKMNEGEIFQYTDMHQDFMKRNGKVLSLSKLLIAYSLIGLILTCFGLFGISWYATRQRIREISIRKIHGATSRQIVLLLNKPFCLQILLAYILAVPIVYWLMHHWHEQFAYKAPFTVMDFLLPLCIVWIISAVTVCLQSYLLNKTNPIDCIKSE